MSPRVIDYFANQLTKQDRRNGTMAIKGRYETYRAKANAKTALALAATDSPFTIEIRFIGGLTEPQKDAFKTAADRWTKIIVGDLPSVKVNGEVIDDVMIQAQGVDIDGKGGILGMAGPRWLRPKVAGPTAYLPASGIMSFDKADLQNMEQNNTLIDVITHEMGHVLGFGTIWGKEHKRLLKGAGTTNPTFKGKMAMEEYRKLRGAGAKLKQVPVENTGGPGTADSHWRETLFRNELMSGFIAASGNPLSRLTVASLQDIGYTVDLDAAESYKLPNLMDLAERGLLAAHSTPINLGMMLPNIPMVLPDDSMK